MAQGAFFRDDLVLSKQQDENNAYLIIPAPLEATPIDQLRRDDTDTVVDAQTLSAFFIDDAGTKHAANFSPDAVKVTGTFELDRRGGPDDRIIRTTGSFITDGFVVGKWLSIEGSTSSDFALKIKTVAALEITIDETVSRITVDEAAQTLTLHQGWQRLEGLDFREKLTTDANGLWKAKADGAQIKAGRQQFFADVAKYVDDETNRIIAEQAPGYSVLLAEKRQQAAMAQLRKDAGSPDINDLYGDVALFGKRIVDELAASSTGISVTFNATQNRIERTSGSWTTDGYRDGMEVTVSNSASNDDTVTIINVTALNLKIAAADALTQEGPVSVDLSAINTLTGYRKYRADPDEWSANSNDLTDFMSESIVIEWTQRTRNDENTWVQVVKDATVWAASTAYAVDDSVYDKYEGKFYTCNTAHTSGTERTDDAAKWTEYAPNQITLTAFPTTQLELE